jgi:putative SOS response-associated peptidase YedK
MCGRFVLKTNPEILQQTFDLVTVPDSLPPRYNIAPSQPVAVISNKDPQQLEFYKWGLVPFWSKDPSIGYKMINARVETASEKPAFREAFKKRRCLIPATGFYEWAKGKSEKDKQPMYIHMRNDALFAFAGLWETWKDENGVPMQSCTILTGEPNELLENFHHRMAIILHPSDYKLWLSPEEMTPAELMPLLQPFPADEMEAYEVSKIVNSPANDVPECILPLSA